MATNQQLDDAQKETRLELYKQIQRVAAATDQLTEASAAEALNQLAEAFAWTTATTQPH